MTGVFEDFPHNTHLGYEIILSNQSYLARWNAAWLGFTHNYVKLKRGSSFEKFQDKLKNDTEKYFGENLRAMPNQKIEMFVQPLLEVPFSKNFTGDDFPIRSRSILLVLSALSVVVLRTISIENCLFFVFMTLFGILITGMYPAFLCFRTRPQAMLSKPSWNSETGITPAILTTMQFTAAIALIAWGFIVFLQLDHILTIDSFLNKEQVIVVESPIIKSKSL